MTEFWSVKPVMKNGDFVSSSSRILDLENRSLYNSPNETKLPVCMEWKVSDDNSLDAICDFLNDNYNLSESRRVIFTPGLVKLYIGNGVLLYVTNKENGKICGTVGCKINTTVVYDKIEKFAFIKLLCTSKIYRGKKFANVLINEISRYVFMNFSVSQAIFESDKKRKEIKSVSTIRNYIRPLNYAKLNKCGFMDCGEKEQNINSVHKNMLVDDDLDKNYVPYQDVYLDVVYKLYKDYVSRFNIYCQYTKDEFKEILKNECVKTYVVMKNDKIVDFVSYCNINYMGETDVIKGAHLYLYSLNVTSGDLMMGNLLRILNIEVFDVLFITDMGDVKSILLLDNNSCDSDLESYTRVYEHKFLKNKKIYLNMFNWKCMYTPANQIHLSP
jgi:hypothetical protein